MADRIVLNAISYHGHGAIENIVPCLLYTSLLFPAFLSGAFVGAGHARPAASILSTGCGSVSYTHLDVYKRQASDGTERPASW